MRYGRFPMVGIVTIMLQLAIALFLFGTVADVGSGYVMKWSDYGAALPSFTREIALPILRIGPENAHDRPITLWWVWIVWAIVLAIPVATLAATLVAKSAENAARAASAGIALWLTILIALASLVVVGCAIPFACL